MIDERDGLTERTLPWGRLASGEVEHELQRERLGSALEKLDGRIALPTLGLRHRLLAAAQPLGHLRLRQTGFLPRKAKQEANDVHLLSR